MAKAKSITRQKLDSLAKAQREICSRFGVRMGNQRCYYDIPADVLAPFKECRMPPEIIAVGGEDLESYIRACGIQIL